jgi:flagellin-like protein
LQRRAELDRGISAIVGAVILLAITILFATFYIVSLDKLATASQQVMERISEAGASTATLSSIKALWSFNRTHITIYIENQATKTVLVAAIAIIYSDGSYTTISRINGSIAAQVIIDSTTLNTLSLPLGLAPATKTVITLATGGKTPATVSLAIEASPITAVQAVPVKRIEPTATAKAVSLSPTATLGATTWLGTAAIPTKRSTTLSKTYPQTVTSTGGVTYNLQRINRSALYYTDFETLPSDWIENGGQWVSTTGFKGGAIEGRDNNQGVGSASQYCYSKDFSNYSSLWITTKTILRKELGKRQNLYGIALARTSSPKNNSMYAIGINSITRSVEVWSYNVESLVWQLLANTSIPNYDPSNWYVIVANYTVTSTSVNFYVWVYDTSSRQVASLTASSTSPNRFVPVYICLNVYNVHADFDDFIIAVSDPRYVTFGNIPAPGYRIAIYDNLENLVNSTIVASSTALLGVVTDTVVGNGTDGRIIVWDPKGNIVINYIAPRNDAILGGDVYRFVVSGGPSQAFFSDIAIFSNLVKLFSANVSLAVSANISVTLQVLINGSLAYHGTGQTFNVFIPVTAPGHTYNITLVFNSSNPFKATIWLSVSGSGLFRDYVAKVLLVASNTKVLFYNISALSYAQSLYPLYTLDAYTLFDGSAAIAYNSTSYVLYMVNRSGLYVWDPGWSLATSACRSVGAGARVELVNRYVVVLPGSQANNICIYDALTKNTDTVSLQQFSLYQYTSSAVLRDSIVFTALDSDGRVALLMLNTTTRGVTILDHTPFYCLAGLATDGSRIYAAPCDFWSSAISSDDSRGIAVWVHDMRTGMSTIVVVRNATTVNLLGYGDRVEVDTDQGILLAVDGSNLHIIDLQYLQIVKKTAVYST